MNYLPEKKIYLAQSLKGIRSQMLRMFHDYVKLTNSKEPDVCKLLSENLGRDEMTLRKMRYLYYGDCKDIILHLVNWLNDQRRLDLDFGKSEPWPFHDITDDSWQS